jgi:hypothetical protein
VRRFLWQLFLAYVCLFPLVVIIYPWLADYAAPGSQLGVVTGLDEGDTFIRWRNLLLGITALAFPLAGVASYLDRKQKSSK